MAVMTVLGVIGLVLVIDRFRRTASILETRVKERTAELSKANTLLKQHIIQRKQAQEELQKANERMKSDLEAAAKTQRSLLPKTPPDVSAVRFAWAFKPCDELAGDIFNVFQLDERQIGLYLLDVSGHGVQAALLSVTLNRLLTQMAQGSLQFEEAGGSQRERLLLSPAEVAGRLNTDFQMAASPGAVQYFTFLYGILNTRTSNFRYVSAGRGLNKSELDSIVQVLESGGIRLKQKKDFRPSDVIDVKRSMLHSGSQRISFSRVKRVWMQYVSIDGWEGDWKVGVGVDGDSELKLVTSRNEAAVRALAKEIAKATEVKIVEKARKTESYFP